MKRRKLSPLILCLAVVSLSSLKLQSQNDPGPRSGPPDAGSFFPTLNPNEQNFFNQAQLRFQEVNSVLGLIAGEDSAGLGPTFNGNSCAQCHAQPTIGGTSPGLTSPQNSIQNPQVGLATLDGATNTVPPFILANGPVREARFIKNANGTLDYLQNGLREKVRIAEGRDAESTAGIVDAQSIRGADTVGGCGGSPTKRGRPDRNQDRQHAGI